MKIREITLALGANLGDRAATLAAARQMIATSVGPIVAATREIETKAWGVEEQPDFLNQVIIVRPEITGADVAGEDLADWLHDLLTLTQSIETGLGRARKSHWGPRTCDIDIIFVDRLRFESERLSLPHPWWRARSFVGGLIESDLPGLRPFG